MRALLGVLVLATVAFAAPATLDPKHGPTLERLLAHVPDAQRLLRPETCKRERAGVYHCHKRGCAGACQVVVARATVFVGARGGMRLRDVTLDRLGDTGECGCCWALE